MSEAARLRAQKAYSAELEYLERMAVREEARDGLTSRSKRDPQSVASKSRQDT